MSDWGPPPYPSGGQPGPYGGPPDQWTGAAPTGGYTTPPQMPYQYADPLISPDYSGWWTRGLNIAKRGWKPLAALQAVGVIMSLVIQAPVAAYAALVADDVNRSIGSSDPNTPPDLAPLFGLIGFALLTALLSIIVAALVTVATVHVGVNIAIGSGPRVADAVRLALRRVFPFIGWQLLAIPIYIAGVCLCVLPVLYVAAVFTVLPVVVAAERTNAISRCFSLFHREFGTAVARTATIIGIAIGAAIVGSVIGAIIDSAVTSSSPGRSGIIAGTVASTLVGAVIAGAIAILTAPLTLTAYADLRSRVEPQLTTLQIAVDLGIAQPVAQPWPPAAPPAPPGSTWPPAAPPAPPGSTWPPAAPPAPPTPPWPGGPPTPPPS